MNRPAASAPLAPTVMTSNLGRDFRPLSIDKVAKSGFDDRNRKGITGAFVPQRYGTLDPLVQFQFNSVRQRSHHPNIEQRRRLRASGRPWPPAQCAAAHTFFLVKYNMPVSTSRKINTWKPMRLRASSEGSATHIRNAARSLAY